MGILSDRQIERDVKITPYAEGIKREGKISYGSTSYGYDARAGYKWQVFCPILATEIDPKNFDPSIMVEIDLTPIPCAYEPVPPDDHRNMRSAPLVLKWRCNCCGHETIVSPSIMAINRTVEELACPQANQPPNFIRVPPHSFVLGETVEEFDLPRDVLCVVVGKSTYARTGLIVNVTPGEPEWKGKWTIELSNTTHLPIRVYCGEGIMQCLFFRSDEERDVLVEDYLMCHGEFDRKNLKEALDKASCRRSYLDKKGKYQEQIGLTPPKVD